MIREFTITDSKGQNPISLNDFNTYLAYNPTSLGIYRKAEYIKIQDKRIGVNNMPEYRKIGLNLYIFGSTRDGIEVNYNRLRDYIELNLLGGFRLYYKTVDEARYIECDILILDKTEKSRGYMSVALEIYPKSLWQIDVEAKTINSADAQSTDMFNFGYNEDTGDYEVAFDEIDTDFYAIQFGTGNIIDTTITNSGMVESNTVVRIYGYANNPILKLCSITTGEVIQYVAFNGIAVLRGEYIEINGNPDNTYIELVKSSGQRISVEQYVDIESNIFITIPKGTYRVELVDSSNSENCYAIIVFQNQYYGG